MAALAMVLNEFYQIITSARTGKSKEPDLPALL
jgi:hypothetical protein